MEQPEQLMKKETLRLTIVDEDGKFFTDNMEKKGLISKARIHYSAQSVNYIPEDYDAEKIDFCDCCMLPEEKVGIVEPFKYCDDINKFAQCGIGTYLYFYFMKFILFTLFIILFMNAVPFTTVSLEYSDQLFRFCNSTNLKIENCTRYKEIESNLNFTDWLAQMNTQSSIDYSNVFANLTESKLNTKDIIIDYNIIHIITVATLLVINIFMIMIVDLLSKEADFGHVTPSDFTLMISNINVKYTNELDDELKLDDNKSPLLFNMTFKLNQYFQYKNQLNYLKKVFNELVATNQEVYIKCCKPRITKQQVVEKVEGLKGELKNYLKQVDSQNRSQLFNGVVFATFEYNKTYDEYLNHFPHSFIGLTFARIHYIISRYLCCCFYSEKTKQRLRKKIEWKVERAPEPEDVIWENLEYSEWSRNFRAFGVYLVSILLICISFGVILALNYAQSKTNKSITSQNSKYAISLCISVTITIINSIIPIVLKKLSEYEESVSLTNFYLTLSIKITIVILLYNSKLTFINTALVPWVSNIINRSSGLEETDLVNNLLLIFLSNALISPLMWASNISFFLRRLKIWRLEKNHKPDEELPITQRELNEIYEKPDMEISYKYSFIAKTSLLTVFYIPIFPAGVLISMIGVGLAYVIEKYNLTHTYKRPQMIDQTICAFYVNNFKFFLFIYAIGNWIFLNNESNIFAIASIIFFGCLCLLPINFMLKFNFFKVKESDILSKDYFSYYFEFLKDYERANPLTRNKGEINYLERMRYEKLITEEQLEELKKQLKENELNIIECYYRSARNIPLKSTNYLSQMKSINHKNFLSSDVKTRFVQSVFNIESISNEAMNKAMFNFVRNRASLVRGTTGDILKSAFIHIKAPNNLFNQLVNQDNMYNHNQNIVENNGSYHNMHIPLDIGENLDLNKNKFN